MPAVERWTRAGQQQKAHANKNELQSERPRLAATRPMPRPKAFNASLKCESPVWSETRMRSGTAVFYDGD
jgi:hypothetical protein